MSLIKTMGYDGYGVNPRQVQIGDVVAGAEQIPATSTSTALIVTGQMLFNSFINASPAGAAAYTVDTAANIIIALQANLGLSLLQNIQNGTTWRLRHITTTAQVVTYAATANTGVTVTQGVVNASSVKDFLLTILNGTPAQTFACTTTNASAVVGGLSQSQCAQLSPGMIVTNAVANLQGTTILAVNTTNGTVTMSGNANATNAAPGVAVSFSPVVTVAGIGQGLL